MNASDGRLRNQLARPHTPFVAEPTRSGISDPDRPLPSPPGATTAPEDGLEFFNDVGGFASGGREYVVRVGGPDGVAPLQ